MYAIIETGGKQYRVQEGDIIDVELLGSDQAVTFTNVLLCSDGKEGLKVGAPFVANCAVHAELIGEAKGPKVIAYKYKRRKNIRRTVGHRQRYSRLKITKIAAG
jgi:large subunit ribosomal protein L21